MLTVIFAWAEDQTSGNAVYFALITGLTVGYGDITPVTPIGKAASAAIAVDALMFVKRSSACLSLTVRRLGGETVVDLASHVAFQAAHDLAGRQPFSGPPGT